MRIAPVALLFATLAAQQIEEPTFRVTVNNVLLDVVVTDSKGNPVPGLQPSDFKITQDNKARPVVSASFVELPRRLASAPSTPTSTTPNPTPQPAQRTIAFVVDDLGLSAQSLHTVREGLRRFIDTQLQPTARVAIVRTGGNIGALQQFTSDSALLRVAASRLRFNPRSRLSVEQDLQIEDATLRGATALTESRPREHALVGSLGTVNMVVSSLAAAPGRRSVILFTDSLPILERQGSSAQDGDELSGYSANSRVLSAIHRLTDSATRHSVVVHTVDAKGVLSYGLDMSETVSRRNIELPATANGKRSTRDIRVTNALDGLKLLARQTGGTFTTNNNDMNDALVKSLNSDASYYLLAYQPDSAVFQAAPDLFHRLTVSVNRPGLQVRYRPGFFGRPDTPASVAATPASAPALHFNLYPAFFQTPEGPVIDSQLFLDPSNLSFTPAPGGLEKTVIVTHLVTLNEQGLPVNQINQDYTLTLKPAQRQELLQSGLIYRVRHPVKKPGAFLMKATLTDKASGRTGSVTQFIDIPDTGKNALALSNLTIARQLHPGDTLEYGAQIINHNGASLQREVRLYADGDPAGHFPLAPFTPIKVEQVAYPVAAGRLQLGPNAAPGTYTLSLTVIDPARKGEKGRATQFATFSVTPR